MAKNAFTLTEIMITLTVIGIISAIIMPIALHNVPDENVLKFKKANSTLYQAIQELVNSDRYYKDGDLGIRADGTQTFNDGTSSVKYFCQTIADVVSAKNVKCSTAHPYGVFAGNSVVVLTNGKNIGKGYTPADVTDETLKEAKKKLDEHCKTAAKSRGKEIELADGVVFYRVGNTAFGSQAHDEEDGTTTVLRYFSPPSQFPANYGDTQGFDVVYSPFCVDVDGFNENVGSENCDDIKDVCPFGYGIRADGKILTGLRADEWLKKDIQGE